MSKIYQPEVLVLPPGGVKGFEILGFLYRLYDKKNHPGVTDKINTFIGVSIGSIACLLLCLNFTVEEIILNSQKFDIFEEFNGSFSFSFKHSSLLDINVLRQKIITIFSKKGISSDITLKNVYDEYHKRLIIVSCNTTEKKPEYFCYKTEPNLKCIDAVLMSCCIPGIFEKQKYKNSKYIDGIFADPYPVKYLDDGKTEILGLYFDDPPEESNNLLSFKDDILISITILQNKSIAESSNRVTNIKLFSVFSNIIVPLAASKKLKKEMIIRGYISCKDFFTEHPNGINKKFVLKQKQKIPYSERE